MNVEFVKYSVNMIGEVDSGMGGRNITKTEQIFVTNEIFVNIMAGNGYTLVKKW
jgi:hypothetical protein